MIEVEDIEVLVASMKSEGVLFRNDIITGPGGRQILAEDPSGNPIEIFHRPDYNATHPPRKPARTASVRLFTSSFV